MAKTNPNAKNVAKTNTTMVMLDCYVISKHDASPYDSNEPENYVHCLSKTKIGTAASNMQATPRPNGADNLSSRAKAKDAHHVSLSMPSAIIPVITGFTLHSQVTGLFSPHLMCSKATWQLLSSCYSYVPLNIFPSKQVDYIV
jgi:hypothetical protein